MPSKIVIHRLTLLFALIIACVLGIAAWGKFFYPAELLRTLDRIVSGFEVLFIIVILCFRNRWKMWAGASGIFAAWSGYALYWCCLHLPCSCMGKMLEIPSLFSIGLDLFFWGISLILIFLLRGRVRKFWWVYPTILIGLFCGLVGYAFADWVYCTLVRA